MSTPTRALHRSRVLLVVANETALVDSKWVRSEVETFQRFHPKKPVVPINVGSAHEQLDSLAGHWLPYKRLMWIDESPSAIEQGLASFDTVQRLAPCRERPFAKGGCAYVIASDSSVHRSSTDLYLEQCRYHHSMERRGEDGRTD